MNKLVYIAGPMRGQDDYNYPLFREVAAELRKHGYQVVNPTEIGDYFGRPEEIATNERLRDLVLSIELQCLVRCDAICLLDGWENSEGARKELHAALEHGLEVMHSPIHVCDYQPTTCGA